MTTTGIILASIAAVLLVGLLIFFLVLKYARAGSGLRRIRPPNRKR